jgi:hypothetical protein
VTQSGRARVVPQTGHDLFTPDSQSKPGMLIGAGTGSLEPRRFGEPTGSGACALTT